MRWYGIDPLIYELARFFIKLLLAIVIISLAGLWIANHLF